MSKVRMPDGSGLQSAVHPGSEQEARKLERSLQARHDFNLKYMAEQGWGDDVRELSIEQIMEIRAQPEWKAAGESGSP